MFGTAVKAAPDRFPNFLSLLIECDLTLVRRDSWVESPTIGVVVTR
jgi:hypothetical protein